MPKLPNQKHSQRATLQNLQNLARPPSEERYVRLRLHHKQERQHLTLALIPGQIAHDVETPDPSLYRPAPNPLLFCSHRTSENTTEPYRDASQKEPAWPFVAIDRDPLSSKDLHQHNRRSAVGTAQEAHVERKSKAEKGYCDKSNTLRDRTNFVERFHQSRYDHHRAPDTSLTPQARSLAPLPLHEILPRDSNHQNSAKR